jgi:hypothetical protein
MRSRAHSYPDAGTFGTRQAALRRRRLDQRQRPQHATEMRAQPLREYRGDWRHKFGIILPNYSSFAAAHLSPWSNTLH